MRESGYLKSLHFNCLRMNDGSVVNMSLPIVLVIDDEANGKIGVSSDVALIGPNGDLIGILRRWHKDMIPLDISSFSLSKMSECMMERRFSFWDNIEIFKHNKEERIARTWGTTASGLLYVEKVITPAGNWLIGGDLKVIKPIKYNDGLDSYKLSPKQLREEFYCHHSDAVFAFQLRNPVHNGHALLMNEICRWLSETGYKNPILLLHPLGSFTKADDVPLDVRMEQHSKVAAYDTEERRMGFLTHHVNQDADLR